nr:Extracellular ligand-binding receptor domain containing protein [Haemonchus contortus]
MSEIWKDNQAPSDGKDALALRAARKFFIIDAEPLNSTTKFVADVIAKMKQPPYNCNDCTNIDPAIALVGEVADAMLMYALALNKSVAAGNPNPNGSDLVDRSVGVFEGFTGRVIINRNYTRDPIFYVWGLNSSDQQIVMMKIIGSVNAEGVLMDSVQPDSVLWRSHGGTKPLNRPLCDYNGRGCPLSFAEQYLAITLASVAAGVLLIIVVSAAIAYVIRARRLEEERLNKLWQIPFLSLTKASSKSGAASSRSLQSTLSTSTKLTIDSKKDSGHHSYFTIGTDPVVARKHQLRVQMKKSDCAILRKMRSDDRDTLCRFVGLCLDAPEMMSVWRYCSRGSLKDVIERGSLQMDWFFKYSLIKDIIEGIIYIHQTYGPHGWLSSGTCLVDERWQVKITYYGLDTIKALEVKEPKYLLWTAPEHIRDPVLPPTKEGDIYSFAIICSEIITKKSAWDLENQDYDIDGKVLN